MKKEKKNNELSLSSEPPFENWKKYIVKRFPLSLKQLTTITKWKDLKDSWVCDFGIYTQDHLDWIQKNIKTEEEFQSCRFNGQTIQNKLSIDEKQNLCFITEYEIEQNQTTEKNKKDTTIKEHPQLAAHRKYIKEKFSLVKQHKEKESKLKETKI
jgi:hypothetical protein